MSKIDPDVKELVQKYILSIVVPSGIFLSLLSFVLGFFVNDWARASAYADAYADAFRESFESIEEVSRSIALYEATSDATQSKAERTLSDVELMSETASGLLADIEAVLASGEYDTLANTAVDLLKEDSDFKSGIVNDWYPNGAIVFGFRPSCPSGWTPIGIFGLEIRDEDADKLKRLPSRFGGSDLYQDTNLRDPGRSLEGYDALRVYACLKD